MASNKPQADVQYRMRNFFLQPSHAWLILGSLFILAGCQPTPPATQYAVTTSWLECCLREFLPVDQSILRVTPPGGCPGHFDISPGVLTRLQTCKAMFQFHFQRASGDQLQKLTQHGLELASIPAPEGLCLPKSYLTACQATADVLKRLEPTHAERYAATMRGVRQRMEQLEQELREQVKRVGWNGARVVTSGHQSVFCKWLGLNPVAVYSGGEAATPAQLEKLVQQGQQAGVRGVIANLQEGKQMGEALSWQLKAPLVVFSNFPTMQADEQRFDDLVRANVARLPTASESTP